MTSKRPHILIASSPATNPTQDGDGNWVPGNPGVETTLPCRYEPNGAGRTIAGPDGTNIVYDGIIYLDKAATSITYGTSIEVKQQDQVIATGKVLRFSAGQMNCRAWV